MIKIKKIGKNFQRVLNAAKNGMMEPKFFIHLGNIIEDLEKENKNLWSEHIELHGKYNQALELLDYMKLKLKKKEK